MNVQMFFILLSLGFGIASSLLLESVMLLGRVWYVCWHTCGWDTGYVYFSLHSVPVYLLEPYMKVTFSLCSSKLTVRLVTFFSLVGETECLLRTTRTAQVTDEGGAVLCLCSVCLSSCEIPAPAVFP